MNQNSSKQFPFYQPMLKESINRFLTEYRKGRETDFTIFTSIFSRTLHTTPNPPIPLVWFYSALEFHVNRLRVAPSNASMLESSKGLFQLLVSCSAGCGSMKRIGVLVPLIFVVYRLVVGENEVKGEIEGLVDGIVSYCSILCGNEIQCDDDEVAISEDELVDLMNVWMVDCDLDGIGDCVIVFFPFVIVFFPYAVNMLQNQT